MGIGVGSYVEVTAPLGLDGEFGSAQAHPDGTFTVMAGTSAHGQGHETAYAQLAASVLKVPMDKVKVVQSDTALVRSGQGTMGSRSLQTGGSAIFNASEQLVTQAREIANFVARWAGRQAPVLPATIRCTNRPLNPLPLTGPLDLSTGSSSSS